MTATTKKENDPAANQPPAVAAALASPAEGEDAATAAGKTGTKPAAAAGARGRGKPKDRIETFDAVRPDGKTVRIVRNIDTGEQTATVQD